VIAIPRPSFAMRILVVTVLLFACGPRLSDDPAWCPTDATEETDPLADLGEACAEYDRFSYPAELMPIPVTIINERTEPVLIFNRLEGCDAMRHTGSRDRYFSVEGDVAGRLVETPPSTCPMQWRSCAYEMFIASEPSPEEVDAAPEGLACRLCGRLVGPVFIEAGGRFVDTWPGELLARTTLPASCPSPEAELECNVTLSPPPPGRYTIDVTVTSAPACGFDLDQCLLAGDQDGHACRDFDPDLGSGRVAWDWLSALGLSCEPTSTAFASWTGGCEPIEVRIGS
jgi:hypothetical protein